jgi:hypothetical protein
MKARVPRLAAGLVALGLAGGVHGAAPEAETKVA